MQLTHQKVTVVTDTLGNTINQSINPEVGYIRLEQVCNMIGSNNWIKNEKRSTLIFGKIEDLKEFNLNSGQGLKGKIIVEEALQPFNAAMADREIKMAGNTGIPCLAYDQPIYRRTRYTTNDLEQDCLIQHTNTDQIKEAIALASSNKITFTMQNT